MSPDTKKSIQIYQYYSLPGNRVMITHPAGAKWVLHKSEVQRKLSGEDHPMRPNSAHETIMLEAAWKTLEEGK